MTIGTKEYAKLGGENLTLKCQEAHSFGRYWMMRLVEICWRMMMKEECGDKDDDGMRRIVIAVAAVMIVAITVG